MHFVQDGNNHMAAAYVTGSQGSEGKPISAIMEHQGASCARRCWCRYKHNNGDIDLSPEICSPGHVVHTSVPSILKFNSTFDANLQAKNMSSNNYMVYQSGKNIYPNAQKTICRLQINQY